MTKSDLTAPDVAATVEPLGGGVPYGALFRDLASEKRRQSCWLIDYRDRPYRAPLDALFQVYHQREEGAPWFRVLRLGGPLWLPVTTTRAQFLAVAAASGFLPGRYQLTPVTWMGKFCGSPPRPVRFDHFVKP